MANIPGLDLSKAVVLEQRRIILPGGDQAQQLGQTANQLNGLGKNDSIFNTQAQGLVNTANQVANQAGMGNIANAGDLAQNPNSLADVITKIFEIINAITQLQKGQQAGQQDPAAAQQQGVEPAAQKAEPTAAQKGAPSPNNAYMGGGDNATEKTAEQKDGAQQKENKGDGAIAKFLDIVSQLLGLDSKKTEAAPEGKEQVAAQKEIEADNKEVDKADKKDEPVANQVAGDDKSAPKVDGKGNTVFNININVNLGSGDKGTTATAAAGQAAPQAGQPAELGMGAPSFGPPAGLGGGLGGGFAPQMGLGLGMKKGIMA